MRIIRYSGWINPIGNLIRLYKPYNIMIPAENADNLSKALQKIEDFRKKHSDMENELRKRLLALKKKNLKSFLKQIQ